MDSEIKDRRDNLMVNMGFIKAVAKNDVPRIAFDVYRHLGKFVLPISIRIFTSQSIRAGVRTPTTDIENHQFKLIASGDSFIYKEVYEESEITKTQFSLRLAMRFMIDCVMDDFDKLVKEVGLMKEVDLVVHWDGQVQLFKDYFPNTTVRNVYKLDPTEYTFHFKQVSTSPKVQSVKMNNFKQAISSITTKILNIKRDFPDLLESDVWTDFVKTCLEK